MLYHVSIVLSFLLLNNIPVYYVPHFIYPIISWWTVVSLSSFYGQIYFLIGQSPLKPHSTPFLLHVLTLNDVGSFSFLASPTQHKTSIFTMAMGREKQWELISALGCLGLEVTHVASVYSLLTRCSHKDSDSVLFLRAQKKEEKHQILVSPSNVYPWKANNLASLQTIILKIFVKRVFREEAEYCWVLRMKINRTPLGSI